MEPNRTRKCYFSPSSEALMSSDEKHTRDPGPMYPKIFNTKRKKKGLRYSMIAPALCLLLIHFGSSPRCNNLAVASPVEEDPQNYNSRANEGFSLNSPRKSDRSRGHKNRGNKKTASSDTDSKGIKVITTKC